MKGIKYTEPTSYMPKSVRDKYFGKKKKTESTKKTGAKKKSK